MIKKLWRKFRNFGLYCIKHDEVYTFCGGWAGDMDCASCEREYFESIARK